MSDTLLLGRGYGRRVGLLTSAASVDATRTALPFWWVEDAGEPEFVVRVDDAAPERSVRALELWVAEHAVGLVFVHAAAVVVDGRAMLLPGRSATGKTTVTAALLRAGAEYASDEYAVLDADGFVHPYPRPLSVRDGERRVQLAAADLGARTCTSRTPVGAVALLTYVAGSPWAPRTVGAADAVLRVLDNVVSARSRPRESLDAVRAATLSAHVLDGARGDAAAVAAHLLSALRTPGQRTT